MIFLSEKTIFEMANMAKNYGDNGIADTVVALTLHSHTRPSSPLHAVKIIVETAQDAAVEDVMANVVSDDNDAYYDLLIVEFSEEQVSIPVPMLSADALALIGSLYLRGLVDVVERSDHDRQVEPDEEIVAELRAEMEKRVSLLLVRNARSWALRLTED